MHESRAFMASYEGYNKGKELGARDPRLGVAALITIVLVRFAKKQLSAS